MPATEPARVVFAGGGTGGHLYPAIAIAQRLSTENADVTFVGSADRLEATIVPKAGYRLETVRCSPLHRGLAGLGSVSVNLAGTLQSIALLHRLRPDVVVATGGYVSVPVMLAARVLRAFGASRARLALLEPNATPGRANRMLAPLVDEIWGAFPVAGDRFSSKFVMTGVPVRESLKNLPPRALAAARFGLDARRPILFALGGSLGARTITQAVLELAGRDGLPAGWQVLLIAGSAMPSPSPDVVVVPYLDDVADAFAAADAVLARAGGSTLAELAAVGKPSILVPYPYAADDHQSENARRFAERGAAVVVRDDELGTRLAPLLESMTPERLSVLQRAAARSSVGDPTEEVASRVERLAGRNNRR